MQRLQLRLLLAAAALAVLLLLQAPAKMLRSSIGKTPTFPHASEQLASRMSTPAGPRTGRNSSGSRRPCCLPRSRGWGDTVQEQPALPTGSAGGARALPEVAGSDLDIVTANVTTWSKAQDLFAWYAEEGAERQAPHIWLLQEHRQKAPEQLESARTWSSQAGLRIELGRADSTGGAVQESSGGTAVAAAVPLLGSEVHPSALEKDIPRSRCQVGVVNTGM